MKWNKKYKLIALSVLSTCSLLAGCGNSKFETSAAPAQLAGDIENQTAYAMPESSQEEAPYEPEANLWQEQENTERYSEIKENEFIGAKENPISTFSIDVDTASYANIRRFIREGCLPPTDAIRTEELINYFSYDYPEPKGEVPFSITQEMMTCPWNKAHQLLLVGLQGKTLDDRELPPSNLVFLIDVSGSMDEENKLPLLKQSFSVLTSHLKSRDTVSIVVYAGSAGVVLDGAEGNDERKIKEALESLSAGGSTAGSEGIERAYELAESHFIEGGNNRVIIATDGDFNVGPSSIEELEAIITSKAKKGVYLTTLGFGMGNYKDDIMETLADKGNGNYAYIDTLKEAEKVLGEEMSGTLYTIAKDVKIQVEFNEHKVEGYRLIGYENRILAKEDFNNDKVDAGEIGAGHRVTALYEIELADEDKESKIGYYEETDIKQGEEYGLVKLRYKNEEEVKSNLMLCKFKPQKGEISKNIAFASAVAEYALILRDSVYKGDASLENVIKTIAIYMGEDSYKQEFMNMVYETKQLMKVTVDN